MRLFLKLGFVAALATFALGQGIDPVHSSPGDSPCTPQWARHFVEEQAALVDDGRHRPPQPSRCSLAILSMASFGVILPAIASAMMGHQTADKAG